MAVREFSILAQRVTAELVWIETETQLIINLQWLQNYFLPAGIKGWLHKHYTAVMHKTGVLSVQVFTCKKISQRESKIFSILWSMIDVLSLGSYLPQKQEVTGGKLYF